MEQGLTHHVVQPPDPIAYRQARRVSDFYDRTRAGSLYYLAGVAILAVVGRYFEDFWPLVLTWLLAFALLHRLRLAHRPPPSTSEAALTQRWWHEHWLIEKLGCLLWAAALAGVGLIEGKSSTQLLIAVVFSIAYASEAADRFAMDRRQAWASVTLILWPAIVYLYIESSSLRTPMLTMAMYSAYLIAYVQRRANDYDRAIDTELGLIYSRAVVERLSRIDSLTGLANRREYLTVYDWAWNQVRRNKQSLVLLVIDLDHFKLINDRHGQDAGDASLVHVAAMLDKVFRRAQDFVARIGGEEFIVLMPGASEQDARVRAEEFRQQLDSSPCDYSSRHIPITASIGLCLVDLERDASPDASFARADQACYRAKTEGRNRVVVA